MVASLLVTGLVSSGSVRTDLVRGTVPLVKSALSFRVVGTIVESLCRIKRIAADTRTDRQV